MATIVSNTPAEFAAVGADNWQDRVQFWALFCLENGWTGLAARFLEVGRAKLFGHPVDEEFCAESVARLIGNVYELDQMGGAL